MHREVTDRSRQGIFSYRFLGKCMSEIYVSEIGRTIYIYVIYNHIYAREKYDIYMYIISSSLFIHFSLPRWKKFH